MKIQNIGVRLILGFSIILLLVLFLGGMAYIQSYRLWLNTDNLYNHPLQVSRATRDIKADILIIHRSIKDLATSKNNNEIQVELKRINDCEDRIFKAFDVLKKQYLGPQSDIDSVYNSYKDWQVIRIETIRLKLNGQDDLAISRTKPDFVGGKQVDKLMRQIQRVIVYSGQRADQFYLNAQKEKDNLFARLWIFIIAILLILMLIAVILLRAIHRPLQELKSVTEQYSHGNYDARSSVISANEFGILSTAFNNMADAVQTEVITKENAAQIAQWLQEENDLNPFCKLLISSLLKKTNAQVAAVYFLNNETRMFEHIESVGLATGNTRPFSADTNEGEFGFVLMSKNIQRISRIPEDTVFSFPMVCGDFRPGEIITIPILEAGEVLAIISLASIEGFTFRTIQLLHEIWPMLNARISGVLSYKKISDFSLKLDHQNKELEEKTSELRTQADELREYNIELELQKKQLDEANQLKSAFLSNMSHELRTPLNSVIALSGVLSNRLKKNIPKEEFSYLEIIEKNGKQLLRMINDILDLSRIESGKEEVIFSEFSIYSLVQPILESLTPVYKGKDIQVKNLTINNGIKVVSDNVKCYHILQNIISNALKFTEKGSVEITAAIIDEKVKIAVNDSGIGISSDKQMIIFDEFRQADEKNSRKFGGTGLGLAIAKKYSILLGGYIEVESEPGVGSTFTLVLPLKPEQNEITQTSLAGQIIAERGSAINTVAEKSGRGITIMLVEDSEPQIIQMKDILTEEGYQLLIARDGTEALEMLKNTVPDGIILDLMMPGVDGFEVLGNIRTNKGTCHLPVLILTAKHVTKEELSFLEGNHIFQLIRKGDINKNDLLFQIHKMFISRQNELPQQKERKAIQLKKDEKAKILVIEDIAENRITVNAILGEKYHLIFAEDGLQGLSKAKAILPHLILLDISLPGMDGYSVLKEIRKTEQTKHIPAIALTAKAMKGDREELLAFGFDGYISKPVDTNSMEKIINQWLNE